MVKLIQICIVFVDKINGVLDVREVFVPFSEVSILSFFMLILSQISSLESFLLFLVFKSILENLTNVLLPHSDYFT